MEEVDVLLGKGRLGVRQSCNQWTAPLWPDSMLADYIRPIAEKAGFGRIGWHTFRHSFSSWGKQVLTLEETKELVRHANIQTTSDIYGGLSLNAKRAAQMRLVEFVHASGGKAAEKEQS